MYIKLATYIALNFFILINNAHSVELNFTKTWVFIVGILEWSDSSYGSFSKLERVDEKLYDTFKNLGVPKTQLVYLKDQEATNSKINQSLSKMLAQTKSGDTLFIYFAGHGELVDGKGYFVSHDADGINFDTTYWSIKGLFNKLDSQFKGSMAIITGDNCFSGQITTEAKKRKSSIQYITLTSTTDDKISTGNWTFTEAIVDGFAGESHVDFNQDKVITLEELKIHTSNMMGLKEQQTITSTINNTNKDIIVTSVQKQTIEYKTGQKVTVFATGDYYVATILKKSKNLYFVHYDDFSDDEDEWVTDSQIIKLN